MQKLCTLFIGCNYELLTARHSAHCTEVTTKAVDSYVKLKLYIVTRGLILRVLTQLLTVATNLYPHAYIHVHAVLLLTSI